MASPLHVIILAAGEGKRMKSTVPKVLQKIAGRPMLGRVVDAARGLQPARIHIVYGHGGDQVQAAFAGEGDLDWAEQDRQLGTGHAVQQAMPAVPDGAQVLVLYGDVPLIQTETLQRLLAAEGRLAVLVADLDDPTVPGLREWLLRKLTPVLPGLKDVRVAIVGACTYAPEFLPPRPGEGLPGAVRFTFEAAQSLAELVSKLPAPLRAPNESLTPFMLSEAPEAIDTVTALLKPAPVVPAGVRLS